MHRNRQQGVALLAALVAAIIMGFIIATLLARTNANIATMRAIKERVEAEIYADSVLQQLLFEHFKQSNTNKQWNYFGREFKFNEQTTVSLRDTNSLLPITSTSRSRWRGLLSSVGLPSGQQAQFLDCLEDWQDSDDLKRLNGGETDFYRANNRPGPRNGFPQSTAELQLICGWPSFAHDELADNLIEMNAGGFNPLMASKLVLNTLSFTEEEIEYIVRARESESIRSIANELGLSTSDFVDLNVSDTVKINLRVRRDGVEARRDVVFNFNYQYDTAPILQFWYWSE